MSSGRRWMAWAWCAAASLMVGLIGFGASSLFYALNARAAESNVQTRPVRPLIARRVTTYYGSSGAVSSIVAAQYVRYSDHSLVVAQQELYPQKADLLTHILDRRKEQEIYVDSRTRSVTTMSLSRSKQERMTSGNATESCLAEDLQRAKPDGVYFGHQTLLLTEAWPGGEITENWIIPELDCFVVKAIARVGNARTEEVVESLEEGEPSGSWLTVPLDYTERSPSAVHDLVMKATGQSAFGHSWGETMEKEYQRRKARLRILGTRKGALA